MPCSIGAGAALRLSRILPISPSSQRRQSPERSSQHSPLMRPPHPRESEIVPLLPGLFLRSRIQEFLPPLPRLAGDQWFVCALVGGAIPVEIPHVQPLAQNLVRGTPVELLTTQRHALAAEFLNEAFQRIPASPETAKQLRDDSRSRRVRNYDALAVGAVDVPLAYYGAPG